MNKIVVFNALQTSLNGGIGRYSYELAKELYINNPENIKIVIREEDLDLFDFAKNEDLIIASNIKNSKMRNIYEQFKLPQIIYKKFPEAIIHYPDSMAPLFSKNNVVITIHDLAFKSLNNIFTWKTIIWKKIITKLSIRKADKIIAITKFTESELLRHYPKIDKNKIVVVYNGFNDFSSESINEGNVSDKIKNINKSYILTVSTISPRKNIDRLIKAFNLVKDKTNCNLVIAGKNGWMYENVYKVVEELGISDRIFFTGCINDDELKYLYKNANLFVYPSFYEGFGLPPLEAMSFGVPVAVSNKTSIPEVVGINECFFEPFDTNEISMKILDIIHNVNLQKNIIEKSYKRLSMFSWKSCAQNMIKVYKSF
jgi:Glycosyltransferase